MPTPFPAGKGVGERIAVETERIELPDGAWVEVRTVVSRRMRKAFRKAGIASVLSGGASNGAGPIDLADPEAIKAHIMAHPEKWDLDAVDDAYLVQGITTWSWDRPAVDIDTLDSLPADALERVLVRLRILYAEATPETLKA